MIHIPHYDGDIPDRQLNPPDDLLPEIDDPMIDINNDEAAIFDNDDDYFPVFMSATE
jgi:hypothetical protein